jgi:MIP family channel proteins
MALFLEHFRRSKLQWGMPRSITGFRRDELQVPVVDTKAMFAEFLGTLCLVTVGCGTACSNGWSTAQSRIIVSFAFGLTLMVLTYTLGHHSGAHFNVAVTFSFLISQEIHLFTAVAYTIAQLFGSLIGAGLLCIIFPCELDLTMTLASNIIDPSYADTGRAVVTEAFGTLLLCLAVRETAATNKTATGKNACIAIGFAAFVAHLLLLPVDNCSISPFRSTASAIISSLRSCENRADGAFDDLWVMWLGPMIGAGFSAIIAHPGWARYAKKYGMI